MNYEKESRKIHDVREKIGMVFQSYDLFPNMNILDNLILAPRMVQKREKEEVKKEAELLLERVGLLEKKKDYSRQLSGGQKQRVAIVRALLMHPEVLLLDEPCSALDVKSSAVIEEMLTELKKQYTIVIVTHNIAQARRISDYAAFLFGGRLVEWGESEQLFGCPVEEETRAFLAGIYG